MRLILWLTPLETVVVVTVVPVTGPGVVKSISVPFTKMEVLSMLKAVMFEAALIKVFAISVLLGTDVGAKLRPTLLMIDPLLNEITIKARNEANALR